MVVVRQLVQLNSSEGTELCISQHHQSVHQQSAALVAHTGHCLPGQALPKLNIALMLAYAFVRQLE